MKGKNVIDEQHQISTPVVQVWDGILLVPLIGTLDNQRTQQVMEELLAGVTDSNSSVALIEERM